MLAQTDDGALNRLVVVDISAVRTLASSWRLLRSMGGAYTKNPSAVDLNTPAKSKLIFSPAIIRL
jgi:hypothetical protein